ncbi:unnamed protein product [Bartonella choladocola]|uniref:hypothetical protein n=1 Tax=Bartonella TaxID=773 RepID=UPI0018DEC1AB|nr:hypothetical protein [Bartonella choladocola]MBI0140499.1 hypothetical protein [Bartonella choladocola]
MTRKAGSDNYFKQFTPQNIVMVLLATVVCFVIALLYCLSKPEIYDAKAEFSIRQKAGFMTSDGIKENVPPVLPSDTVYQKMARFFKDAAVGNDLTAFYHSLSIKEYPDHIELVFSDESGTRARLMLQNVLNVLTKDFLNSDQRGNGNELSKIREERNKHLESALENFKNNWKTDDYKAGNAELYGALISAVDNRIAYMASIEVLGNLLETGKSPLDLDFIARDPAVQNTRANLNKLATEIAHMETQLGSTHPQIEAMMSEQNALKQELDRHINLAIERLYTEADLCVKVENGLRDELIKAGDINNQSGKQALDQLEEKLKSIWADYDKKTDDRGLADNQNIEVSPISVEKRSLLSRFGWPLSIFTLVIFLVLLVASLFLAKCWKKERKHVSGQEKSQTSKNSVDISSAPVKAPEQLKLDFAGLVDEIRKFNLRIVTVVGKDAAQASARLSMKLRSVEKSVLLVDISTNEIGNLIGPHRGFTDVLTGDAKISEVIYSDYDTGVDILPRGIASLLRAKDFASDIPTLIDALKEQYAVILIAMSEVSEFGVEEIFKQSNCLVISCHDLNDQDSWRNLFSKYSDQPLFTLIDS